jgi:PAS domain-containing protein
MDTIKWGRRMINSPTSTLEGHEGLRERRRGERAPARSDLDFRLLLEALPAAAYTCDAEGCITYFNRRAVEAWGREPKLNDPLDRY